MGVKSLCDKFTVAGVRCSHPKILATSAPRKIAGAPRDGVARLPADGNISGIANHLTVIRTGDPAAIATPFMDRPTEE